MGCVSFGFLALMAYLCRKYHASIYAKGRKFCFTSLEVSHFFSKMSHEALGFEFILFPFSNCSRVYVVCHLSIVNRSIDM